MYCFVGRVSSIALLTESQVLLSWASLRVCWPVKVNWSGIRLWLLLLGFLRIFFYKIPSYAPYYFPVNYHGMQDTIHVVKSSGCETLHSEKFPQGDLDEVDIRNLCWRLKLNLSCYFCYNVRITLEVQVKVHIVRKHWNKKVKSHERYWLIENTLVQCGSATPFATHVSMSIRSTRGMDESMFTN